MQKGTLEVFTEMEGHEFVIERLGPKSVINPNNIFVEDFMYCNIRCSTPCRLLELNEKKFWDKAADHHRFEKKLKKFSNKMLQRGDKVPLDYILWTGKNQREADKQRRRMVLKNCVYRIIVEKRIHKGKPKLHELLRLFEEKGMTPKDPVQKQIIIQQVLQIYSSKPIFMF